MNRLPQDLGRWSRRLARVLRHHPEHAGVALDESGWVEIADLVAGLPGLTSEIVHAVARGDAKGRFTIEGSRIRAAQGHSRGLAPAVAGSPVDPPELLYHGTVHRCVAAILRDGLLPGARNQVHLSGDTATATAVGGRRGTPVVLTVRAREAARSGVRFYRADNGVWLSDAVPGWFVEPPAGRQGNVRRTEGPPPT